MKQRFFCDFCGSEVSADDEKCPVCGRVLGQTVCPKCGFEGRSSRFANGCPKCGYLSPQKPRESALQRALVVAVAALSALVALAIAAHIHENW